MSTPPPDFFSSNDDDARREHSPAQDQQKPTGPADDEAKRPPTPAPAPASTPATTSATTAGERRPAPQPTAPRWGAGIPGASIPQQPSPHQSGPIPRQPGPPPPRAGAPSQAGSSWPPIVEQPPADAHDNGTGQHRRTPPPQGHSATPASGDKPEGGTLAAPTGPRPARRDDPDFGEHTGVIPAEHIAQARQLGPGFFNEPADPGAQQPPRDSHALFNGPMGGEPFAPPGYAGGGSSAPGLAAPIRRADATGWRKAVSVMTFGLITPGPAAKQVAAEELVRRIRASLLDVFVVGFVNSKGGVGKTTMAVAAGNAIARERGDRVIVVDVDTDLGNLSARFHEDGGPNANIERFSALPDAGSYSKVRVFTVQNEDRLEMLSSQNDPRSSYRLTSTDFESTMRILRWHYNVVLLDCGTSITSPLFSTIANQVDCLVVVASQDSPGLNGADRTQQWLASHGLSRLLPRTVVVLNRTAQHKPKVDVDDAASHFREKGAEEVVLVPFDDHLDEGGAVEFHRMGKATRKAVMELAGAIARYYPSRQSPRRAEGTGGY